MRTLSGLRAAAASWLLEDMAKAPGRTRGLLLPPAVVGFIGFLFAYVFMLGWLAISGRPAPASTAAWWAMLHAWQLWTVVVFAGAMLAWTFVRYVLVKLQLLVGFFAWTLLLPLVLFAIVAFSLLPPTNLLVFATVVAVVAYNVALAILGRFRFVRAWLAKAATRTTGNVAYLPARPARPGRFPT